MCVEGVGCYKWFANMSRLFTHPNHKPLARLMHGTAIPLSPTLSNPTLPMRQPVDRTKHPLPPPSPIDHI